jgi:hypothetical protein
MLISEHEHNISLMKVPVRDRDLAWQLLLEPMTQTDSTLSKIPQRDAFHDITTS